MVFEFSKKPVIIGIFDEQVDQVDCLDIFTQAASTKTIVAQFGEPGSIERGASIEVYQ